MNFKNVSYKSLILISLILLTSFQSSTSVNVEKLFTVTKTKETTEQMVKEVIAMYKKRYPNVSVMTWGSIESNINYNGYYKKIKQIYSSNYTDAEIKELIKLYNPKTMDKYTLKTKKVEQQLYDAGKEFGKELSQLINSKIK
jgi:hypothetical protein